MRRQLKYFHWRFIYHNKWFINYQWISGYYEYCVIILRNLFLFTTFHHLLQKMFLTEKHKSSLSFFIALYHRRFFCKYRLLCWCVYAFMLHVTLTNRSRKHIHHIKNYVLYIKNTTMSEGNWVGQNKIYFGCMFTIQS